MKVLSLFDGMCCGMLAMQAAGVEVDRYVAYEIDKYAIKVASHNFPQIEQCGDVFKADFTKYNGFDYLIGGSPCTYWSIAQKNNRETEASGLGWELFSQYVRALHEAKPKFFIYENNKSMSKQIRASIDKTFGFEAVGINSALVSAQNRQRLYWVGKREPDGTYSKVDVQQPEDRGILLKDVLDNAVAWQDKAYAYTTRCSAAIPDDTLEKHRHTMVAVPVNTCSKCEHYELDICDKLNIRVCGDEYCCKKFAQKIAQQQDWWGEEQNPVCMRYERTGEAKRVCKAYEAGEVHHGFHEFSEMHPRMDGKTNTLSTVLKDNPVCEPVAEAVGQETSSKIYEVRNGLITIKGKQYPIKLADGYYIIRKLTVAECKRLQTVPEWYDFSVISNSQAYKCLGNGWTVEVIAHLINATAR